MRQHAPITVALLAVAVLVLVACGGAQDNGSAAPDVPSTELPDAAPPSTETTTNADPSGQEPPSPVPAGDPDEFVGLTFDAAVTLAETQERPWRVGREDDERFALTEDYIVGRVTFELDGGVVTRALIEGEGASGDEAVPPSSGAEDATEPEQARRAQLLALATERIVTTDNSFGGGDVFDRVEIETAVGGGTGEPLAPLERELIAAAIEDVATPVFIPSAADAIDSYFPGQAGVAVVSVTDLRIEGDRAEIDMSLWCGSLCAIFLTYEAELVNGAWRILGTTGPIAVS